MAARVLIAAVVASLGGSAWAEPARVEVRALAGAPVPPGLVDTLRIHLAGAASVEVGAPLTGATLAHRIGEASGALAAGGLVTWLEPGPDAQSYVVVVVGERDGRAAIEVGRLDGSDPGAISRLLALRIGAFLDETIAAGARSPVAAPVVVATAPAPRPVRAVPPAAPARPAGTVGLIAEVGGGGEGDGHGVHGEAALAIGARHHRPTHRAELVAIGRFGWPRETTAAAGAVSLRLIDLGVGARLVVPVGPAWLGGAAEVGARRIDADGRDDTGAGGAAVRWLARVRVGLDARFDLVPAVTVRATIGVERGLAVERFTVHGAPVAEVGALAAAAGVAVVFPLGRQ